jgi:hypothetical protein
MVSSFLRAYQAHLTCKQRARQTNLFITPSSHVVEELITGIFLSLVDILRLSHRMHVMFQPTSQDNISCRPTLPESQWMQITKVLLATVSLLNLKYAELVAPMHCS